MMRANKTLSMLLAALLCAVLMVILAPAARAVPFTWGDVQAAITGAASGDVIDLSGITDVSPATAVTITVGDDKTITLVGTGSAFTNVAFVFGSNNTITIENLNITSAASQTGPGYSPLHFSGENNTLTLVGTNTIVSGQASSAPNYGAAVGVPYGAELTINGTGSLTATGSVGGAGIGGGYLCDGGTITINGGSVIATGGDGGAGIGGGHGGEGGTINIGGSAVITKAEGSNGGAGIGGGCSGAIDGTSGNGGIINIGGNAQVNAKGSNYHTEGYGGSAGIGGGREGSGGTITISGGNTTAEGGEGGAGIGSGSSTSTAVADGGNITISGGTVNATGGNGAYSPSPTFSCGGGAGIGSGGGIAFNYTPTTSGNSGTIIITGDADVTATGGDSDDSANHGGAGIGSGGAADFDQTYGTVGTADAITISTSGVVTATGGEGAGSPGAKIGLGGRYNASGAETVYITKHPGNRTVTEGSITGALTVEAAVYGQTPAFTYQWYENIDDSNTGGTLIAGATDATFTIPTDLTAGTYYYYCVVSATGAEPATSNVAVVTVNPATPGPGPGPGPSSSRTGGGPMQPSVVTLTPSMNPYYGLGGLSLTSSGFAGQFRSLSMNGQPLREGTDYTVENAGGLAVLHVNEAVLAGINGDVRFEAVFSDATGSCTVRVFAAYVPDEIIINPPKTGDGAGYTGIALLLFAFAGARVMMGTRRGCRARHP